MSSPTTVIGTVATHPRMITTTSGVRICSFRLASGDRRYDRVQQKWVDGETNWMTVTAFRSIAEHASASLRRGERVIVFGRLRIRSWEKDGKSGTSVEIEADALGHDLRWGTTSFVKRTIPQAQSDAETLTSAAEPVRTGAAAETERAPDADDDAPSPLEGGSNDGLAHEGAADGPSGDGFIPAAA